ncbi:cation-independent mannose-6-phosphate receptor-like [Mytilus galloprovincialis]|uniref:cation-independent mannose-6-phosphate receptor-like n=1 Tax=Mytilus galloprovincialis TaxID=29158 RepID=UPI003F7CBED3
MYLVVFIVVLLNNYLVESCEFNGVNFTKLDSFGQWKSASDDRNTSYMIKLCNSLSTSDSIPGCHSNTHICMTRKNDPKFTKPLSTGNSTESGKPNNAKHNVTGEVWFIAAGDPCPDDPTENLTSIINFRCGLTMGSPVFVEYSSCTSYFEWQTVFVCKDVLKTAVKEVPCYVYDDDNEKYDLTQLIKPESGYLVDSTEGWDFYINVCRDITAGAATAKCPKGSGACRIHGDTVNDMGQPDQKLKRNINGNLELRYSSQQNVTGCTVHPSTAIEFICPKKGGSKDPILISDFNCQYKIEWYTEHACKESFITSKTCRITQEDRNIDINLSPLTHDKASNHPYEAKTMLKNQYWINVCEDIGIQCPDSDHVKGVAACQTYFESTEAHVLGKTDKMLLRYADGDLTLTYRGGETCNHSHFKRATVINFICNATADHNGSGWPKFDYEYECTYYFKWETKYACLNHPVDAECRVNYNGKRFDLSPLVRHSGMNWEVLDVDRNNKKNRYFINMCNDLLLTGDAARCHPDTSVCLIDDKSNVHNLGSYTQNPAYDNSTGTDLLQITFTNGDPCQAGNKKKKSIVTFVCKPGDLESGPVFIRSSLDECIYEFEWYTASACIQLHSTGDQCRVFDKQAGINFDLSKLTKPSKDYYNVTTDKYFYLMNVCDKVDGVQSCGTTSNPGVCQVSKASNGNSFNIGQTTGKLNYYDGMINLTYTNGDAYHVTPVHNRTTEIAFLCDRGAGIGHPEFIEEKDYYYNFKWFTSYACPNPPIECTVTDSLSNKQYDLSSLSKSGDQGNWEILDDHNPNHKTKYYINVCRPVNQVGIGKGCATFAAACQSKFDQNGLEVIDASYADRGEITKGPQIEGNGRLYLQYKTQSKLCTEDNGQKSPFITTIHFVCTKGALTRGPNIPIQIGNCEQSIIWETEAACPLAIAETDTCTVKDPNSDYMYNLNPLKKKGDIDYYKVMNVANGKTTTYRINVCGEISTTNCAKTMNFSSTMCEEKTGGIKQGIANMHNYKLYFSDDGQLTLNYYGARNGTTGKVTEVIILFLCKQDIEYGVPIFEKKEEEKYFFKFETALACSPQPVDCVAQDSSGHQYDLSNLARIHDWKVPDPRPGHTDLSYYINVCRPINTIQGTSCPGGPVGGCQVSTHGGSFNMGYIQSKPVVVGDGTLVIRYRNGDVCHAGTKRQAHRSTRITFMCSLVEHDPVFEGETEECEYIFHWMTPSACKQNPSKIGKDCKVVDTLYNYEFDLNILKKDTDYNVTAGEFSYLLNICQGVKTANTGCGSNTAVCQTKPADKTFHKDSGNVNAGLVYDEGEITLTYNEGEPCHSGKFKRKTIITFSCDQSVTGRDGPHFINETSDCIYQFIWPTRYACPPFRTGECTAQDSVSGKTFDLSTLAMTDNNYEYIDYTKKKKYIFNVCRSLVHKKGQICPFNSAACEIDYQSTNNTYHNLGEVNAQQVLVDNGKVELFYTNGELCEDGKTKVSTRVIFYCSQSVKDSHPGGHFRVGCEHHFVWSTEAGCPITETVGNNCTVTNPETGHVFNLNGLSKKGFSIEDKRGHTFDLQICKALQTSDCVGTSGACQKEKLGLKRKWNAGNANSQLVLDDGILMLNYTGGTSCHHNTFQRNTVINFVCSKDAGQGTPVFVDESDDCTYFIHWKTELACEEKILCTADIGKDKTLDLSPLIKRSGHHLVLPSSSQTTNETFYINVCEPLNPIYNTLCPPGASACSVKAGSKPISLGKLKARPYNDTKTGKITLVYIHGNKCPSNDKQNASTRIVFNCKPGPEQGEPRLESVSADCVYNFVWDTNVVCQESDIQVPVSLKDCVYKDDSGLYIDLKELKTDTPIEVQNTENGKTVKYLMNICDKVKTSTPGCGSTSICKVDGAKGFQYGSVGSGTFTKLDGDLQMYFRNGDTCQGNTKSSGMIQFKCDPDVPIGKPEISFIKPCQAAFTWNTRQVCPNVADSCSLSYGGHIYDLNILSSTTKSWQAKDSAGNQYWLNICEGVHSNLKSESCPATAAGCRKTKSGIIDTLGLISTQKLTMDADGKTLVLEYSHGNSACSHAKRRSDNLLAKVVIKFECGNTVGGPVYVPGSDSNSCVFEFKWKSHVACRVEREEIGVTKNNTITDPRSGGIIHLDKLTLRSYTLSEGKSTYYIDTSGQANGCNGAVVCKHVANVEGGMNIGQLNNRKFYIEDDVLQAEYSSDQECEHDKSKKSKSIIQFHCNSKESIPYLLSESRDCVYLFIWETPHTCITPQVVIQTPASTGSNTGNNAAQANNNKKDESGSGKIGIIVAVFSVAILVCVLLIIFHKAERRSAFKAKITSIFSRDGRERTLYNSLPSADDEDENNDDDEVVLLTHEEQMSSRIESADGQTHDLTDDVKILNPFADAEGGYHDDSDEDLLA